jgi:hypothetical protein
MIATAFFVTLDQQNQMSKISKSPERYTFQAENYVKRCVEEGKEPSEDYLNLYKSARQQDAENMVDPKWQKDNLEYDLRSTDWILTKARASDSYAQNIYAALCNNDFTKLEVLPILKEEKWSCSWRHAGGIVADMRQEGDYIDWYCSGIGNKELGNGLDGADGIDYVPEGCITKEIRADLQELGWVPAPNGDWEKFEKDN